MSLCVREGEGGYQRQGWVRKRRGRGGHSGKVSKVSVIGTKGGSRIGKSVSGEEDEEESEGGGGGAEEVEEG